MCDYGVETLGVSISSESVTLWANFVPMYTPRCPESAEMSIIGMNRRRMKTVPIVKGSFECMVRDGTSQVEWGLSLVFFSNGVFVEWLKVNSSTSLSIFLLSDDHLVEPSDGLTRREEF